VIEDGLPHLGVPGPSLGRHPAPRGGPEPDAEDFSPTAPVEIRRVPRRMPTVDDFPPVAQREYHAKAGYEAAGARRPAAPQAEEAAPRKPGLLRRLTGLGLRSDSPPPAPAGHVPWDETAEQDEGRPGGARARSKGEPDLPQEPSDDEDFPRIYQRDRRGS
jgi:hypothetical protein